MMIFNFLDHWRDFRRQRAFEKGFAQAMLMYFYQELPLEYIVETRIRVEDPWDDGFVEAIDVINFLEQKLNGPLFEGNRMREES